MDQCVSEPLSTTAQVMVFADYAWGTLGLVAVLLLIRFGKLEKWVLWAYGLGWVLGVTFELPQQLLNFTYAANCAIDTLEPKYVMWIFHAAGDSVLLLLILGLAYLIWRRRMLEKFLWPAAIFMGVLGMIQEFIVESTQQIWVYESDNPWNPVWANWNDRDMTVQQWHWLILPVIYYAIIRFWLYPKFGPKDAELADQPEQPVS